MQTSKGFGRTFESGMESHNLVLKNANLLLDNSIQIRIRNTFDSKSVSNLYNDIKFMIDEGFKCIVSAPNLFDKDLDLEKIEILEEQMKKVNVKGVKYIIIVREQDVK